MKVIIPEIIGTNIIRTSFYGELNKQSTHFAILDTFFKSSSMHSDAVWDNCSNGLIKQPAIFHHEVAAIISRGTHVCTCNIQKLICELGRDTLKERHSWLISL